MLLNDINKIVKQVIKILNDGEKNITTDKVKLIQKLTKKDSGIVEDDEQYIYDFGLDHFNGRVTSREVEEKARAIIVSHSVLTIVENKKDGKITIDLNVRASYYDRWNCIQEKWITIKTWRV